MMRDPETLEDRLRMLGGCGGVEGEVGVGRKARGRTSSSEITAGGTVSLALGKG